MTLPRWRQIGFAALAAALVAGAAAMQPVLDGFGAEQDQQQQAILQANPQLSMLSLIPGGLRAPVVNYLWVRSQELKRAGRVHDARQLAAAICQLQPHFDGVWAFHAWNMAWNISVSTHTPQERWKWVSNGMELLRDQGIPLNPDSLGLYKELGWLFFSKMGGNTDEMHMVYKRRWSYEMQRLLGAPPPGVAGDVIEAFRPIAEAPLNKADLARTKPIQPDQLARLLEDPKVADYVARLGELGVVIDGEFGDPSFLTAYNQWSMDEAVDTIRLTTPQPQDEREERLFELINDPAHADAREAIVAFVRAQLLWTHYKMDPDWMLELMTTYNLPIDWRLVWPHGLYWVTYGIHKTQSLGLDDIDSLNTDRVLLNSMKELTWSGRMVYLEDPQQPDMPQIAFAADWRYVEPTHQEHLRLINAILEQNQAEQKSRSEREVWERDTFEKNIFAAGHVNYLEDAMAMLLAGGQKQAAQEYYEYVKQAYKKEGGDWDLADVEDFVIRQYSRDGTPIPSVARSQITAALQSAFVHLGRGNHERYRQSIDYARKVMRAQAELPERSQLQQLEQIASGILMQLILEPRQYGYRLGLEERSVLYRRLGDGAQRYLYAAVERHLREKTEASGLEFDKAFPKPAGYEQWLAEQEQRSVTPSPDPTVTPQR